VHYYTAKTPILTWLLAPDRQPKAGLAACLVQSGWPSLSWLSCPVPAPPVSMQAQTKSDSMFAINASAAAPLCLHNQLSAMLHGSRSNDCCLLHICLRVARLALAGYVQGKSCPQAHTRLPHGGDRGLLVMVIVWHRAVAACSSVVKEVL